jgi:hypothetical protein
MILWVASIPRVGRASHRCTQETPEAKAKQTTTGKLFFERTAATDQQEQIDKVVDNIDSINERGIDAS